MKSNLNDMFEGLNINKKVINGIFLTFFGLFAVGILTLIYFENKAGDCDHSKKEFYLFEYEGKILRTYRSKNHGHWTTVFENGVEKSLIFDYKTWGNIKPGDILIKHKNELNFILIRGIDTNYYTEKIPDCEQFKN
jgi:hypothetical protein